ncbi:T6SS immunity protein Tli4 family protein [Paraburkholderia sp. CNPSo 3274]|uniref:T6SS immunity protein Tli4 family protein n=1 Tax=Paraburkholderia sp. CNPSo 3274 TaxID=2940932 RepID=UPI0020B6426F|nr:T6SS immunity protein Tli4 family protein [Paraburkholderia sp. CNPSo 3274]MCP3708648.1 T6SS immunity protein Tli4 family protein [Paraburkholderia sp. CNPSo 3274]
MIENLTSNMKSICVGRFLMNAPQDARIVGDVKLYFGLDKSFKTVDVSIESLDSTVATLGTAMDAEALEIDRGDKNWKTKKSNLLDYRVVDDHTIYLRQQDGGESAAASKHELHLLVGKTQLALTATSYEGVDGAGRFEPGGRVETPEQVAARLFRIASEIRPYETAEKAGPGYCLGPVVVDSGQDEEEGNTYMFLDRYPDFHFSIYNKGLTPDPSDYLTQRVKDASGLPQVHTFRNRDITLGGIKAHEWLGRLTDHDHGDITLLTFVAESMRRDPAMVRPHMNINLDAGGQLVRGPKENIGKYISSSLTPKEAMGLWDAMIPSIRLRPDAMRQKGDGSMTSR